MLLQLLAKNILKIVSIVIGIFMVGSIWSLSEDTITVYKETGLIVHSNNLIIEGYANATGCKLNCVAPECKTFNDYGKLVATWDFNRGTMVLNQLKTAVHGKGIGTALFQSACLALKQIGHKKMEWTADPYVATLTHSTLPQLIKFYTKNGGTMVREKLDTAEFEINFDQNFN